jgi:cation:H+ antiporter
MDIITLILFIFGFVLLISGAEVLVRGASRLAIAAGLTPLVVGLTVVAYGTSAPELAVSVQASFAGQSDIALGNIVGSNISNILLVLGVSAAVAPLAVSQQLVRWDIPVMIGLSILLFVMGLDGLISRWDGVILFAGAIGYTVLAIRYSRQQVKVVRAERSEKTVERKLRPSPRQIAGQLGFIIAGLGLLVLGARWLVNGAVITARIFGVNELVIGLTIVAVGTSLPEIATSIIAGLRGQRDIAVGNAVGSNIFNILLVLGLCSIVAPNGINVSAPALAFDIPIMIAVAVACLPIFFSGYRIARWEGFLFLGYYAAYTAYLFLNATHHAALTTFSWIMATFVIPLTVLTLVVITIRASRANRRNPAG